MEVEAYYEANPDRFVFASLKDLPANLDWEDGSDLEPFGDPRAQRGGRLKLRLNSMQQTLRVLGPDANGSLRSPLWNGNAVFLVGRHPWSEGFYPGLAREWAIDPHDARTVYLRLDPDARWSDGRPFTIEDVFFSLYFLLSPHINDPAINGVIDENITRLTRYDETTFSITQTNPSPDPLGLVSTLILSQREFYREFGPDYVDRYHWRFAPVTGPYTVDPEQIKRGQQITFERLENWWADDKPFYRYRYNPDKITFIVIRDDAKAYESFLNGNIDWHSLNRTELWYDKADAEPKRYGYIKRAWFYDQIPAARNGVYINSMHQGLDNKDLRLGIQHAINYDWVNEGLFRGDRRRIRSFADGYGRYSHPTLRARAFDPESAREYFAKAGYSLRGGDGVLMNEDGQRLSFDLTVSSGGDDVAIASILKEQALLTGLELRIDALEPTSYFTKTFEKNFQMAIHGWYTGYSPLPAFQWELRTDDAGKPKNFNTTNIDDPELDALIKEWELADDPEKASQISHAIQERVHEFAAWVPGLTAGYSRIGYWRWIQWPAYFMVPQYSAISDTGLFWIDEAMQEETREARRQGRTFPPVTEIFDRWKSTPYESDGL
jgi:microcin C transport system substrate-binding protein